MAVIFNHLHLEVWYQTLPKIFWPVLDTLLVNGMTGVGILFLLTGFLMSWLHPKPSSPLAFWSRRYARLFPVFLVMVVSWTIIRMIGNLPGLAEIGIVIGCAFLGRAIWEIGLKFSNRMPIGKYLTIFWMLFQSGVAAWYVFFLLKIPSAVFYQLWDQNLRWLITGMVNATLTFPFGNYIGELDGVYWSLSTEVMFYLLYPILFVPIFQYINQNQSKVWKIFLFLSAFPFSWGISLIFHRFLNFQIMVPFLIIYFIVGVALGSNLEWFQKQISRLPKFFLKPLVAVPMVLLIFSISAIYRFIPQTYHPVVHYLLVFPIGLLLVILTIEGKSWGILLGKKWLANFGKYSYSLYVTHALCIDLVRRVIVPVNFLKGLELALLSIFLSYCLSWCLFQLVEKPYFLLKKKSSEAKFALKVLPKRLFVESFALYRKTVAIFSFVLIFIAYLAFRFPVSLLTYVYPVGNTPLFSLLRGETGLSITSNPVSFDFVGQTNGLGMIMTYLKNDSSEANEEIREPTQLLIKLKDSQKQVIAQSSFNPGVIPLSRFHPFGFPIQTGSKEKEYSIEYQILPVNSSVRSEIVTTEEKFIPVYFVDKKKLLGNPSLFAEWLANKLTEPFRSPGFWLSFMSISPLILLLWAKTLPLRLKRKAAMLVKGT